jgi:hypothetical protein
VSDLEPPPWPADDGDLDGVDASFLDDPSSDAGQQPLDLDPPVDAADAEAWDLGQEAAEHRGGSSEPGVGDPGRSRGDAGEADEIRLELEPTDGSQDRVQAAVEDVVGSLDEVLLDDGWPMSDLGVVSPAGLLAVADVVGVDLDPVALATLAAGDAGLDLRAGVRVLDAAGADVHVEHGSPAALLTRLRRGDEVICELDQGGVAAVVWADDAADEVLLESLSDGAQRRARLTTLSERWRGSGYEMVVSAIRERDLSAVLLPVAVESLDGGHGGDPG